ncbi:MAG: HNH endonuclease, partial [Metamycoplasmataceae bacterium]
MNKSNRFNISDEKYEAIKKIVINDERVHNKHYFNNCPIKAEFWVDILFENYYEGKTAVSLQKAFYERTGEWNRKEANGDDISLIRDWFKLNPINKKIKENCSREEFKNFLLKYLTNIIESDKDIPKNQRGKIKNEWENYLTSIGITQSSFEKFHINDKIYEELKIILTDDSREHKSNLYIHNSVIETKYFIDILIKNYYYGENAESILKQYLNKQIKPDSSYLSKLKDWFKLSIKSVALKEKLAKYSEREVKNFLIKYLNNIIESDNDIPEKRREKIKMEWRDYLTELEINNNHEELNLYEVTEIEEAAIEKIKNDDTISETEKETLYKARIGQGKYRRDLLKIYDNTCVLSDLKVPELLIASHIVPWSKADNKARVDPYNGLLLLASIDKLFDSNLISFDEQGKLVISKTL